MVIRTKGDIEREEEEEFVETVEEEKIYPPVETVKEILDVENVLQEIEATLAGCRIIQNPDGTKTWKKVSKEILNEKGRQEILQIMRARLNKIYKTSILDMQYIAVEVYLFNMDLIRILSKKAKEWDLDIVYFRELVNRLTSSFEAIVRMSLAGATLKLAFGQAIIEQQKSKWSWLK